MTNNLDVDRYVEHSEHWPDEIAALRPILRNCGLDEDLKSDPDGVLESQGQNSRSARRMCFRSVDDVARLADTVAAYVSEAIAVENAGLHVGPAPDLVLVDELEVRLSGDHALRAAFDALTPGRQREYNLYFSDARQSATRSSRVEKYAPKILAGKGFRDR